MSCTHFNYKLIALTFAVALLTACSSPIPDAIRIAPSHEVSISTTQRAPKSYIGAQVRWGGDIISVENRSNDTWIEILAHPLDYTGEPMSDSNSTGRFLARVNGFIDPKIYTSERKITIRGVMESIVVRQIGEHPYRFPLVQAQIHYLWPKPLENDGVWQDPWYPYPYAYPYRYDPFYGPRSPYYWDPYFPPPRHRHRHKH